MSRQHHSAVLDEGRHGAACSFRRKTRTIKIIDTRSRVFGGITLRFGVVTTTVNENERALLGRGSLWKRRSEPGRNQEESGEKLLRKLMRSQVFSEVFRASLRFQPGKPRFQPRFRRGFCRGFVGVSPGKSRFLGCFFDPLDRLSSGFQNRCGGLVALEVIACVFVVTRGSLRCVALAHVTPHPRECLG